MNCSPTQPLGSVNPVHLPLGLLEGLMDLEAEKRLVEAMGLVHLITWGEGTRTHPCRLVKNPTHLLS